MSETMRGDHRATRDLSSQSGASSSAGGGAGGTATNLKGLKPVEIPKRGAVMKQIVNELSKTFSVTS